jgi:hypothetical protein
MRSDLNKQLCEHERVGSSMSFGEHRHNKKFETDYAYDDEDRQSSVDAGGSYRESMKRRYVVSGYQKEFSENFAPLWGAIRKNLNRPWDKVYSEICKVFDKRSVINQHILIHLFQFVETNTYLDADGKVMVRSNYGGNYDLNGSTEYYVHPKTGILLKNKRYRSYRHSRKAAADQYQREQLEHTRILSSTETLKKENGVWFHIHKTIVPAVYGYVERPATRQGWQKRNSDTHTYMVKECIRASYEVEQKRTLSKKELRDYELTNG